MHKLRFIGINGMFMEIYSKAVAKGHREQGNARDFRSFSYSFQFSALSWMRFLPSSAAERSKKTSGLTNVSYFFTRHATMRFHTFRLKVMRFQKPDLYRKRFPF